MLFDTHAHYDSEHFHADRHELLAALPEKGVGLIVNPGCDGKTSRTAVELTARHPHVYAAVGWHPEEWESWTEESIPLLRQLAGEKKVVAIGEIGRRCPNLSLACRAVLGSVICTAGELATGLVFNRDHAIWDYRALPGNFRGQICLPYSLLWVPLSALAAVLFRRLDGKSFRIPKI